MAGEGSLGVHLGVLIYFHICNKRKTRKWFECKFIPCIQGLDVPSWNNSVGPSHVKYISGQVLAILHIYLNNAQVCSRHIWTSPSQVTHISEQCPGVFQTYLDKYQAGSKHIRTTTKHLTYLSGKVPGMFQTYLDKSQAFSRPIWTNSRHVPDNLRTDCLCDEWSHGRIYYTLVPKDPSKPKSSDHIKAESFL